MVNRKRKKRRDLSVIDHESKKVLERFKNRNAIINRLAEITVDMATYQFLAELFFQFLRHETKDDPMPEDELRKLVNTRFEIMELYELVRAAKLLLDQRGQS